MVQTIDADTVRRMMDDDEDVVLIDALRPASYRLRHLPGAINIPAGGPAEQELVREHLPADKATRIVVYCADARCDASPTLARRLEREYGYTRVFDFEEGLAGWKKADGTFERPWREQPRFAKPSRPY